MPPMQSNPLDALKKLLAGSPDLNAASPSGMVGSRLKQEDQFKEMSKTRDRMRATGGMTGSTPTDFADLSHLLNESPNFGQEAEARVGGINAANDQAIQAGFRGDQNIASALPSQQDGERIYANVGNRSGDNPAQMAGKSAAMANMLKTQMPLLTEQAKSQGAIDLANQKKGNSADLLKLLRGEQGTNTPHAGDRTSVNINPDGEMSINSTMGVAPKFSMQEQSAMNSAHTVNDLGERVMHNYEQQHPDIASNTDKYSSIMDAIPSMLGGRLFYAAGAKVPEFLGGSSNDSQTRQLIGAIQMNAARAIATGRLSGPVLDFIQKHLPDGGYSPGENYNRIKTLHDIIGPSILEGIAQGHGLEPGQLPGGGAADPYADPNWGKR